MFFCVSDNAFLAGICITINAEMPTSIIHTNIFANHTTAYFTLSSIFNFTHLIRYWG